jgi:hypothetical protein
MSSKFRLGQNVRFTSNMPGRPGSSGSYNVVRVLPHEHEEQQYRIKSKGEEHERVARESQLEKAD